MQFNSILITGGAGFIGSHILRYLLAKYPDNKVINLDYLTYAGNMITIDNLNEHKNYKFVHGSINDKALVEDIFSTYNINVIINVAAETHVDNSINTPLLFAQTNILGTINLMEVAKNNWSRNGYSNSLFLQISTDEVYGSLNTEGVFTELSPFSPNSPYSASKASADHWVMAYHNTYKLPVIITHCSNNYGPFQYPEKLIPKTIQNILQNKSIPIYGDGKNIRDWIYIDDHIDAIGHLLQGGSLGETYNIGGNQEVNNLSLVQHLCGIVDKKIGNAIDSTSLITFVEDRKGHDFRYAVSTKKMEKELHWQPKIPLQHGLAKTVEWYLQHQAWVEQVASN